MSGVTSCFDDRRKPELSEHGVPHLLAQGINGLAMGYVDLNGHYRHYSYEDFYCQRGEMDCPDAERPWDGEARLQSRRQNRIKEQQVDLSADRASRHRMAGNRLRLWFGAFAHLLMHQLRACVLKGTGLERATIGQIRLRLFKIAVRSKVSVRRIPTLPNPEENKGLKRKINSSSALQFSSTAFW